MTEEQTAWADEITSSLVWLGREVTGQGFGRDNQEKMIARVAYLFAQLRASLEA